MKTTKFLIIYLVIILWGCSKESDTPEYKTFVINKLEGKVEKGPFTQGSTVTIQELSKDLTLTGNSFQTDITNDEGNFKIESAKEFVSSYVQLACDGYFFNEVTGKLSNSQIRLESITDISEKESININVLTHLSKDRIINLMKEEDYSYKDATSKAREELLTCFGLQEYKEIQFEDLSITSGENSSGVLIIVSSILLADRTEAQLTEYISSLKETFTTSGKFSESEIKSLQEQSKKLTVSDITSNIVNRYKDLGKDVLVPDLKYYIDWDGDGIAGNELGDPNSEKQLSFEVETLQVDKEGGEFRVRINATVPFTIYSNDNVYDGSQNSILSDVEFGDIKVVDNELVVSVSSASDPFLKPAIVTITTHDQSLKADLTIIQKGDFSNELSKDYITSIITQAATAFDYTYTIEALYSNCYTTNSSQWDMYVSHNVSASNSNINNAWNSLYRLNHSINSIQNLAGNSSLIYFTSLRTLLYYYLTTLWGSVPYVTQINIESHPSPETISDIYSSLQTLLEESINELSIEDNGSFFNVSKNVPRALLAKVLIKQNKHSEAYTLLQEIISSGMYALNANRNEILTSLSTEMIYAIDREAFSTPNYTGNIETGKYLPLIQYSEIILLAAECANKIGNNDDAINYLNQIRARNGNNLATFSSFEVDLKETWKDCMKGGFSYFDYLKRNDLVINELNIEDYQKLLPIPDSEVIINSNLSQNPGY